MSSERANTKELIDARDKIEAQLMQLEGASRGLGDCRAVYAELQEELNVLNELLEADNEEADRDQLESDKSAYYPPSPATQSHNPKRSVILTLVALGSVLWLVFLLLRSFF